MNGDTQINAWKDVEARSTDEATDHPAGEVTLPKSRTRVARANALAGYVVASALATQVVPTLSMFAHCTIV
jgi:hypothetical protein